MCRGCGSRPSRLSAAAASPTASSSPPITLQDEQFKLIEYNHPSVGQQTTIGQAVFPNRLEGIDMIGSRNGGWRIKYGWRGRGDKFLAHVEDIRIAPHLFVPIEHGPRPPQMERESPAPPTALELAQGADTYEEDDAAGLPPAPKRIDLAAVIAADVPVPRSKSQERRLEIQTEGQARNLFDWQKLPGVTARIAKQLDGLDLEDIIEMGEEGLMELDYVGPTRAKSILAAAKEAMSA